MLWESMRLLLIVYAPGMQHAFGTYGLPAGDWQIVLRVALTVIPVLDLGNWIIRGSVPDERVLGRSEPAASACHIPTRE